MNFIYGLNKSGISIINLLKKNNEIFHIWDDNENVRKKIKKIFKNQLFLNPLRVNLLKYTNIYVTPGISFKKNIFNKFRNKNNLKRDLSLYISKIKKEKIVAITGTNGKSTSTKLIGDILKNKNTFVGGNIGKPLCEAFISQKKYKYHVIELSSFQLENIKNFTSNISVITNLSIDHTDRYKNINDYIKQKKNILTKSGINILSIDDKYSKRIFSENNNYKKISFSTKSTNADIYIKDKFIFDKIFKKNKIFQLNNISKDLQGDFNKQNILVAYICSKILKIPEKMFLNSIMNFKGLPFRFQLIYERKNLKIINNSKSTNIDSAINSIKNYKNIYLIIGGRAKEKNFDEFIKYKKLINCIYLYGESGEFIYNKLKNRINIKLFKNLNSVVNNLFKDLQEFKKDTYVLFSPACSSYDQYKNFEERGETFTSLINKQIKKI